MRLLARITAPYFVAGLDFYKGKADVCAPIIKYMNGWSMQRVYEYCQSRGWKIETVQRGSTINLTPENQ